MSNIILHIFICSNIFKWLLCQRTHQDFTWKRTLIKLPFGHKMASVINLKKIIFLCQATSLFCSKLKWKYFFGQTCRSGLFSLIFVIPRLPEDLWLSRRPWPETARLSSEYGPQVWITILSLSLSASLLPLLRSKQSHQMMINFGKIISFFCKASDIFFQQPRMTTTSHRYVAFLRVGHSRPLFIYFRLFKRVDSKKVKKYSI